MSRDALHPARCPSRAVRSVCLTNLGWRGQDIYYTGPEELLAGLRAIRDDPTVRVLRVRSGLLCCPCGIGPGEVAVTLQVATEGTRRLGLDAHAAEVQPIPPPPPAFPFLRNSLPSKTRLRWQHPRREYPHPLPPVRARRKGPTLAGCSTAHSRRPRPTSASLTGV
jgi:hypothetical protein